MTPVARPLRRLAAAALLAALAVAPAPAQEAGGRAAIERQLNRIESDLRDIRGQVGGVSQTQPPVGVLDRLESMEGELRRLTAQIERIDFERRQSAADAEARLQDLEVRIVELEGGDPDAVLRARAGGAGTGGAVEAPPPAAGTATPPRPTAPDRPATGAPPAALGALRGEIAAEERAAFNAAAQDLETLGVAAGRDSFGRFVSDYPASPLAGEAWRQLGDAYARAGRHQEAARAFLTGVRDHGGGPAAAENLLGLGSALTDLGQMTQACAAYAEFAARFPAAPPSVKARAAEGARRAACR